MKFGFQACPAPSATTGQTYTGSPLQNRALMRLKSLDAT
jgi:hypothetical protein